MGDVCKPALLATLRQEGFEEPPCQDEHRDAADAVFKTLLTT